MTPIRSCIAAIAASLLLAAGCATSPNPALDRAHRSLDDARAANVDEDAPIAFQDAEKAVDRAQRAYADDRDEDEVTRLAELAAVNVETARVQARAAEEREKSEALAEQRTDVLLDARTEEVERLRSALEARETERGLVVTIPDVLFAVDEATLQPGADATLVRVAEFLRAEPDRSVSVEGHTDSTASDAYNLSLSQRRADAVRARLAALGIPAQRIASVGHGESMPIASNANAGGRQQNRRVEIVIENPPAAASMRPR